MVAIAQKTLSFEEFLNWDDDSGRSFELVNGVAMPLSEPTAKHEDVVDGLCRLLVDHCQSLNLPYVPRQSKQVRLNAAPGESESSRKADIVVFAKEEWVRMRQSSASAAAYIPPPLAIEVVSTNWRDDYRIKLNEYETLGILEYWIVDYAGLGGVQYSGSQINEVYRNPVVSSFPGKNSYLTFLKKAIYWFSKTVYCDYQPLNRW
jgi:Uma2 family endonuclease